MIYIVTASLNNSREYYVCYSEYKVYVDASSVEEAKIIGIKYISESNFCVDKSLAYSIYCMHNSPYEEFLESFASKTDTENDVPKGAVRTFWESISRLQNLKSLWDYETKFEDVIDAEFEKDTDQSILNCFYDFPNIKQKILLHELVSVEPLPLNVVDIKAEEYHVS